MIFIQALEETEDFQKIYQNLWDELEKKYNKKSQPYRFLWVLGNFSNNFNPDKFLEYPDTWWIELIETQWDTPINGVDELVLSPGMGNCACSHDISRFFYIYNIENDKYMRVGSDCVQKIDVMGEKLNQSFRNFVDKMKPNIKNLEYFRDHKICENCKERNVPIKSNYNSCVDCRKKNNFRPCITCTNYKISKTEPSYKTQCKACYKLYKSYTNKPNNLTNKMKEKYYRQCQKCQLYNINSEEPEWKKICIDCFKNK